MIGPHSVKDTRPHGVCVETIWKETLKRRQRQLLGTGWGLFQGSFDWPVSLVFTRCTRVLSVPRGIKKWNPGERQKVSLKREASPRDRQGPGEGRAHRGVPGSDPLLAQVYTRQLSLVVSHSSFSGFMSEYEFVGEKREALIKLLENCRAASRVSRCLTPEFPQWPP